MDSEVSTMLETKGVISDKSNNSPKPAPNKEAKVILLW